MPMTLDEWVVFRLQPGPKHFRELLAAAQGAAGWGAMGEPNFFRKLDRALQRLGSAGRIVYSRKRGWELAAR